MTVQYVIAVILLRQLAGGHFKSVRYVMLNVRLEHGAQNYDLYHIEFY